MNTQQNNTRRFRLCLSALALLLSFYLIIPPLYYHYNSISSITNYQEITANIDEGQKNKALQLAKEYNDLLYQTNGMVIPGLTDEILNDDYYESLLNYSDTSIMARLEIPVIGLNLPIYHGTSEQVLSNGIGHLLGTSLPVGGNHTRSVLSGHRASPKAELFSRLDELKKGDLLFIDVLEQKLVYQVTKISVVNPYDVNDLEIIPNHDIVTLVTCTPYGTNKYRLIIDCERITNTELLNINQQENFSIREPILRIVCPIILLFLSLEFFGDFPFFRFAHSLLNKKKG